MSRPDCLPRPHRGAERGGLGERWTAWCNRTDDHYPPAGLLAEIHGVVPERTAGLAEISGATDFVDPAEDDDEAVCRG